MPRFIRFKVKDLLKIIALTTSVIFISYWFLPSVLLSIARGHNDPLVAKVYYDRIIDYFPGHWNTPEALERAAQMSAYENLIMISPTGIGGAHNIGGSLSKVSLEYYKKLAEKFPNTPEGERARRELFIHEVRNLINNDQIKEAKGKIDSFEVTNERFKWYLRDIVEKAARSFTANGHFEVAIEIIEGFLNRNSETKDNDFYEVLGDLYSTVGNAQKAKENYQLVLEGLKEIEEHERNMPKEHRVGYDDSATESYTAQKRNEIIEKIARLTDKPINPGQVKGSITLHGKPLGGIQLFLQPQRSEFSSIFGATFNALWVTSNSDGRFDFNFVQPGRYSLGFVLDLDQVGDVVLKGGHFPKSTMLVEENGTYTWDFDLVKTMKAKSPVDNAVIEGDTIEFAWEPFEGAAYYTLELGTYFSNGWMSKAFGGRYYSNRAFITKDDMSSEPGGMSWDELGPTPESLLGFGRPGGRYFWSVVAKDHDGNILSASRGYLKGQNTDFTFVETTIPQGDSLILERKYGEAIEAYEKTLRAKPEDLHSMRMLARLYGIEGTISRHSEFNFSDMKRSLELYRKLYEITGNIGYLERIGSILYHELGEYDEAFEIFDVLEREGRLYDYYRYSRALILSHNGEYEKALSELQKAESRYYIHESALRIILNKFTNNETKIKDSTENAWLRAMEEYQREYGQRDTEIKEFIRTKTPLEAIEKYDGKNLTPHQEFLIILTKALEPSLRRNLNQDINDYIARSMEIDASFIRIAKLLLMVY
jgi:tetratricopeptide (TPR) repeat protein